MDDLEDELDNRLTKLSKISVRVCGVRREGETARQEITIEVDPDSSLEQMQALLVAQGASYL